MSLTHYEMDKFEDSEDGHYQSVSNEIKNMVDKSKEILKERRIGTLFSHFD